MKKYNTLIAVIIVSVIGTLAHFVFEWTDNSIIAALLTPVNESIWEHLKLLFYPVVFYTAAEYILSQGQRKYLIPARTLSLFIGMLFIVSSYYTIVGVFGSIPDWMNITIYYLSVITVFVLSNILIKNKMKTTVNITVVSIAFIVLLISLFTVWTFYPPTLNIFIDPVDSTRGIFKN